MGPSGDERPDGRSGSTELVLVDAASTVGVRAAGGVVGSEGYRAVNEQPSARPGTARSPRVIVVEDQAVITLDLERRLRRLGFVVAGVADEAAQAEALVDRIEPDLILMDIFLRGETDGIETARRITATRDVPVVFLTAYADDETVRRAAEVSPYGYVLKPFEDRALQTTLTLARERHALDRRLRLLSAAVERAQIGVLLVDVTGPEPRIELCNEAFLRMTGTTSAQVLGRAPCFLAADREAPAVARLRRALADRVPASEVVEGKDPRGDTFWTAVTLSPTADRTGNVTHVSMFHADVTRQRQTELALANSQRLELAGRLAAGVAHDVKNVLASILAFAELAASSRSDTLRLTHLREVMRAAKRGVSLTRRLVDGSTPSDARAVEAVDLGQVLRDLRSTVRHLVVPGTEVVIQVPSEPVRVAIDPTSAEQIITNLALNARDAMPAGGRLTLSLGVVPHATDPDGPRLAVLRVTDTGVGMTEAARARVFQPFFTTKPKGHGSGLGLYMCRLLVEGAHGTVSFTSEAGVGTTFHIQLPSAPGEADPASTSPEGVDDAGQPGGPAQLPGAGDSRRCLLVEDEGALRRVLGRFLEAAGFQVVAAADVDDALHLIDTSEFDVVVSDMVLGLGSGVQVLAAAAEAPGAPALVAMSGNSEVADLPAGATLLCKPFPPATLVATCRQALANRTGGEVAFDSAPLVVLVDADQTVRGTLRHALRGRQMRVVEAATAADAARIIAERDVTTLVADLNLPDADGLSLLGTLRARHPHATAVVMAGDASVQSAQRAVAGRVSAFMAKPAMMISCVEVVERAVREAEVARLQSKLMLSRGGAPSFFAEPTPAMLRFRRALAALRMVYQPIVTAGEGEVVAYEALMRCEALQLTSGELLAAAEVLGTIDALGRRVRTLVAEAIAACESPTVHFFVNLHPSELRRKHLLADDEPLLPYAHRVTLEVIERAQFTGDEDPMATAAALRTAGFRVALDDLGEGYAGLSLLVRLAPDVAKLDMSLVRDIHESPMKREVVGSVVGICRRAGTLVVAEGVERAEEAEALRELGCDLLQGYHFGRPGPLPGRGVDVP